MMELEKVCTVYFFWYALHVYLYLTLRVALFAVHERDYNGAFDFGGAYTRRETS